MYKPLQDKRIVITRSPEQAATMQNALAELGAEVVLFPTVQYLPLPVIWPRIDDYEWLIFTSGNAVRFFFAELEAMMALPKIAAIGSATARTLRQHGVKPDLAPSRFTGERLVAELGDLRGKRVLLPRSRIGRIEIVHQLQQRGAIVDAISIYDTVLPTVSAESRNALAQGYDIITFAAPSSLHNFLTIAGNVLANATIACIGPTTAAAAKECGLRVDIMPAQHTAEGLIQAIVAYFVEEFG